MSNLDSLAFGLSTAAAASGGPGEVSNRHDEEAVAVVGQTGKGVVPGGESGQKTEETTGHEDGLVGLTSRRVTLDVTDTEQQEGQVQEEEEGEEGHGGTESTEEQDSGEDEPSLF